MTKKIYRILLTVLFTLLCLLIPSKYVYADPPDITDTDFYLYNTINNVVPNNIAKIAVFIPWTESLFLLNNNGISSPNISSIINYKNIYTKYLQNNLYLNNNGESCKLDIINIPSKSQDDIMFGNGVQIDGTFTCQNQLGKLVVKNNIFLNDFPAQNNYINVYDKNDGNLGSPSRQAVITSNNREATIDYNTELNNTTNQAINNQASKTIPSATITPVPITATTPVKPSNNNFFMRSLTSQLSKVPLGIAILITFLLGLLHTLEAGHSKTILTASIIHKKVTIWQGIAYAAIFTITHIADILIMGLALLVANFFTDIYSKLAYLQIFSVYSLLIISSYLLIKSVYQLIQSKTNPNHDHHHDDDHDHGHDHHHGEQHFLSSNKDFKHQLFIGFLSGIAPCLFGWSIFMLIISTRKIWVVFPMIGAFGLGIFTALIMVVIIVTKLKTKLFDKQSWIGDLSPIISAAILFIYALSQIL